MGWFYWMAIGCCLMACTASPSKPANIHADALPPASLIAVFGQSLVGDFDGDGTRELLQVVVRDHQTGRQLPAAPQPAQRDSLLAQHSPSTLLEIADGDWPTAILATPETPHWGVSYLQLEGDLDGDGGDELSVVVHWTDVSTVTTLSLWSYKAGAWTRLHEQTIRGSSLPRAAGAGAPDFLRPVGGQTGWVQSYFLNEDALMEYRFLHLNTASEWPSANTAIDNRFLEIGDSINLPELLLMVEYEAGLEDDLDQQDFNLVVEAPFYNRTKTERVVYRYADLSLIMSLYGLKGKLAKADFLQIMHPDTRLDLSIQAVKGSSSIPLAHTLPDTTFRALLSNPPTLQLSRAE